MQETPKMARLHQLIGKISNFPVSLEEILTVAKRFGFDREIIAFISLFHIDTTFRNRQDFITCCEELDVLLEASHSDTPEKLRNP